MYYEANVKLLLIEKKKERTARRLRLVKGFNLGISFHRCSNGNHLK